MTKADLLKLLEDLRDDQFEKFKWHLKNEKVDDIPECQLETAKRQNVVDLMVQKYEFSGAVEVMKSVLKKINRNDLVKELNISSGSEGQSQEETNMTSHPDCSSVTTACLYLFKKKILYWD